MQAFAPRRGRLAQVFNSSFVVFACPKGGGGVGDGACVCCGLSSSTPTWHVRGSFQPSALVWSLLCCTLVVGPIYMHIHSPPVLVRSVNVCLDACGSWHVQLAFERVYTHQRAHSRHTACMHVVRWNIAWQAPSTASRRKDSRIIARSIGAVTRIAQVGGLCTHAWRVYECRC